MKIVYFTHSLASCWNHGNAHFLRGVLRALLRRGHHVQAYEPRDNWSLVNLLGDQGPEGLAAYRSAYPELSSRQLDRISDLAEAVDGADLVIVHEWNSPDVVKALGDLRARGARFRLLFHDTHHRAVSDPKAMRAFDLSGYDGLLAFGEALAVVYRRWGWGDRVFVWHEAADITHFHPPAIQSPRDGLVWIGNWGDGERTAELETFLLGPAKDVGLALDIHGVRYPPAALALLDRYGARYRDWLPNAAAPDVYARHLATVHVPRRFYAKALPGIPTIRVFEALACGIPLVCAPWSDVEGLFRVGCDFLTAKDRPSMARRLRDLRFDGDLRAALAASGLETIRARHTCEHRAAELLAIAAQLETPQLEAAL
jgi:spore maturation protein CgeB